MINFLKSLLLLVSTVFRRVMPVKREPGNRQLLLKLNLKDYMLLMWQAGHSDATHGIRGPGTMSVHTAM